MTCIVGIVRGSTVWLGGDSAATRGDLAQVIIGDPKVVVRNDVAIGVVGSPKVLNAVAHGITGFPTQHNADDKDHVVGTLVPFLQAELAERGCVDKKGMMPTSALLVGYRAQLYVIHGNFQVITPSMGFHALGTGADVAIGSLLTTRGARDPRRRIHAALEAAAIGNAGVRPPFRIVSVGRRPAA